MLIIRDES